MLVVSAPSAPPVGTIMPDTKELGTGRTLNAVDVGSFESVVMDVNAGVVTDVEVIVAVVDTPVLVEVMVLLIIVLDTAVEVDDGPVTQLKAVEFCESDNNRFLTDWVNVIPPSTTRSAPSAS